MTMKALYETLHAPTTEERLGTLEERLKSLENGKAASDTKKQVCIICFSGEWDRLFAALTIASGSLAMGMEVNLFFTFWAISALRRKDPGNGNGQSFLQSMFSNMLPSGFSKAKLSRFNFLGLGKALMRKVMKKSGLDDIDTLYEDVKELGGNIYLCDNTVELFGLDCEQLKTGKDSNRCGVATFLSKAMDSKMVLFV
jgi:peroxiredoxin family protein